MGTDLIEKYKINYLLTKEISHFLMNAIDKSKVDREIPRTLKLVMA